MAPWIARENPAVAGIVALAGSTRPIQDVVIDQAAFFAGREPGNAAAQEGT